MRRSRKLPSSSGGPGAYLTSLGDFLCGKRSPPQPLFTIDEQQWQQIEKAYGNSLSAHARRALLSATTIFILWVDSERGGAKAADVQKAIEAQQKRANELQTKLLSHESGSNREALYFISKNFHDPRLPGNDPRLRKGLLGIAVLHGLLTSFDAACNAALKELSEYPGIEEGDEWTKWIRRLHQVLKVSDLPVGVRKDAGNKSKSDRQSPFTLLVEKLQSFLPPKCRRHMHSLGALATAISLALGSNKLAAPSE